MSQSESHLDQLRIDRDEPLDQGPRWGRWIGGIVVLLVIALVAMTFLRSRAVAVRTVVAREASSSSARRAVLNATGYIVARREATVSSKITAKVVEVLVEEGMKVQEGQILARLDDLNVRAGLQLAEAEAEAVRLARAETRARLDEAEQQWRRVVALSSQQIASASDLDRAAAEVKSLRARLDLQEAQCTVAERQIALWKQQLEDTVIRAPFAGIAVTKNAQPGEMISPISAGGGFTRTGIGTIVDMGSLEIEVDVNESYINRVQARQTVEATLDAYPDWKIPCHVIAIIPTADRQKATVKVRIGFDQLDPRILPQMGVKVAFLGSADVPSSPAFAGVLVPASTLRTNQGKHFVFVVRDGRVEERPADITSRGADGVVVRNGAAPGDRVVLEPPATLKAGDRVRETQR